jgi:hypothetical protein
MSRPAITFEAARAEQIHDVLSELVPTIGRPRPHNPLGVEMGSVLPIIVPLEEILNGSTYSQVTNGVYIVTDDARTVRYVGSVDRASPALKSRLSAHLHRGSQIRRTWAGLGLVRVPESLPRRQVLVCEGWVGRVLDPLDNDRLPFVGGWPWTPRGHGGIKRASRDTADRGAGG